MRIRRYCHIMHERPAPTRRVFAVRPGRAQIWTVFILVVLVSTGLVGYGGWPHSPLAVHAAAPRSGVGSPVTIVTLGDSLTIADGAETSGEPTSSRSWVPAAVGHGVVWSAGFAHGGFTTAMILDDTHRYNADVLVILAGTNDTLQGVPFSQSALSLRAIVAKAGVARVIVAAIPPIDFAPHDAALYNVKLKTLAAKENWDYVDAAKGLRDRDHYIDGLTVDGIHPTAEGAEIFGEALHRAILSEARR